MPDLVDREISEAFSLAKEPERAKYQYYEIQDDVKLIVTQLG